MSDRVDAYRLLVFPLPPGHFRVHSIRGTEGMSSPYVFDVVASAPELPGVDLDQLAVGQRAVLTMHVGRVPRAIHGVIRRVRVEGLRTGSTRRQVRLRLVPELETLRHTKGSRIYQNMSVPEVLQEVLGGHMPVRLLLMKEYPQRAYITQYEESDKAFAERLMAEAGIYYYFAQPTALLSSLMDLATDALESLGPLGQALGAAGEMASALFLKETIVLGDDVSGYLPLDDGEVLRSLADTIGVPTQVDLGPVTIGLASPTLRYVHTPGMAGERFDAISELLPVRSVKTSAAVFSDFDPDRPARALSAEAPSDAPALGALEGIVDVGVSVDPTKGADGIHVDAAIDWSAFMPKKRLEHYEHLGAFQFPDWGDVAREPARILAQRRRRAATAEGASLSTGLSPGYRFTLEEHPIGSANREYTVVAVHHRGEDALEREIYSNTFECVPSDVEYPPARRPRKTVQSTITATVVGPTGEEIYVDGQGRIKVRFHWDRLNGHDGTSSCWIRTMQGWGGAAWGTQFIPRVGMEVVVAFDGGDPDKPIVLGCLYNGTHPMPFSPSVDKTRSGIKTRSTQDGQGYNELSFQDAHGKEQVFVHAQRDFDAVVEHDRGAHVKNDDRTVIGRDRRIEVGHSLLETIGGDATTVVEGNHVEHCHKSRVGVVRGNLGERVTGVRTTRLESNEILEARGRADLHYADDFVHRVDGHSMWMVGRHDKPRTMQLHVEGSASISATRALEIACDTEIVFRVGKSCLRLGASGIELSGSRVSTAGGGATLEASDDGLKLSSKGAAELVAQSVVVKASGSSVGLDSEVKIDGSKILLNSPEMAEHKPKEAEPPTRIELVDQDGNPVPNARYVIALEDGTERSGTLGPDGTAEIALPQGGDIVFLDMAKVD